MSELPHADILRYYSIFQTVTLILSTLIGGCTLFVVVKVSPKFMKTYQWFIFNEVMSSYAFDAAYLTLQPVSLLPYTCTYSVGPFRSYDYLITKINISIVLCVSYYKFVSLTAALFYQYLLSLPPNGNRLVKMLEYPKWQTFTLILIGFVVIDMVIMISFSKADIPQDLIKSDIAQTSAEYMKVVLNEPSLFCQPVQGENYGGTMKYFLAAVFGIFGVFSVFILAFAYLTIRNYFIKKVKTSNPALQRVQRTLLISWMLQLASLLIFIGLPFYIWFVLMLSHPKFENYITLVASCICGLHSIVECFILLIVVIPYRKYVVRVLWGKRIDLRSPGPIVPRKFDEFD